MKKQLFSLIAFLIPVIIQGQNISFKDSEVKRICVANWDTNKDSELSKSEAAAVKDLGWKFSYNETIKTFDELQYFTGLTSIGENAFDYCSSLIAITIPNSITSIGNSAFSGCSGLTSIDIPNSVTSIGESAFSVCSGLTSIDIPNSVTSIGIGAFSSCSGLSSITIPKSLKSIGDYAFYGCNSLKSVYIVDLKAWCEVDFGWLHPLNDAYYYCSNPLVHGADLYLNGELLTDITFPDGLEYINNSAFHNYEKLVSITFPEGLKSIGPSAFESCDNLKSVSVPSTLSYVGPGAFNGCQIQSIYIKDIGAWCGINFKSLLYYGEWDEWWRNKYYDANPISSNTKLYVNGELLTDLVIPDTVKILNNFIFDGYDYLKSVTIPVSVDSIGEGAFRGCSGLTSVDVSNVGSIGRYAFSECGSITDVYVMNKSYWLPILYSPVFGVDENAILHVDSAPLSWSMQYDDHWKEWYEFKEIVLYGHVNAENSKIQENRHFNVSLDIPTGRIYLWDEEEIYMTNWYDSNLFYSFMKLFKGYQFDLNLPKGFHLYEENGTYRYTLSNRLNGEGVNVDISSLQDGMYHVKVSSENSYIKKSDGELIRFVIEADDNVSSDEYVCGILNFQLMGTDGKQYYGGETRFNLVIPKYEQGDVNHDEQINVADVMLTVSHILGNTLTRYHDENADMDGNGNMDVTDVMLIVDKILNSNAVYTANESSFEGLSLTSSGDETVIKLPYASDFTACQMTIHVPESVKLLELHPCTDNSVTTRTSRNPDGSYRLIAYTTDCSVMSSIGDELFRLTTSGEGKISISDIIFSTKQCESVPFSDVSTTTGIEDIGHDASSTREAYDLQGRKHILSPSHRGIYILKGKKHLIHR